MTPRIVVRPRAKAEIRRAHESYREISPALGRRFRDAIRERIVRISERPEMYPRIHGTVRRTITTDFPYFVFYAIESAEIVILRVVHHAQSPEQWPTGAEPR